MAECVRALSFSLRTINSDHSIIRWLASVACNDKLIIILFFELAFKLINSQETGTNQRNVIIFKYLWRQRTKMTYYSHLYDLFCVSRVFYYKKKIISMPIGIRLFFSVLSLALSFRCWSWAFWKGQIHKRHWWIGRLFMITDHRQCSSIGISTLSVISFSCES